MEIAEWYFDHLNELEFEAARAMSSDMAAQEALAIWRAYAAKFSGQMQPFVSLRMDEQRITETGSAKEAAICALRKRVLFQIRRHEDEHGTYFEAWVGEPHEPQVTVVCRLFARELDFDLVLAGFEDVCDDCYGLGTLAHRSCPACAGRGWVRRSGWTPDRQGAPLEKRELAPVGNPRQAALADRYSLAVAG